MREYLGKSAESYSRGIGKYRNFQLLPALSRNLPVAKRGFRLLDLACGTGDAVELVKKKKYNYVGMDVSEEMLKIARTRYTDEFFVKGDGTVFDKDLRESFNVVLINMLFPSLNKKISLEKILRYVYLYLKPRGIAIFSSTHPCFDGYMQSDLWDRDDVKTEFKGYFATGQGYKVSPESSGGSFTFNDYHWPLADLFDVVKGSGFYVDMLDECKIEAKDLKNIPERKINYPGYLMMLLKKLKF